MDHPLHALSFLQIMRQHKKTVSAAKLIDLENHYSNAKLQPQ